MNNHQHNFQRFLYHNYKYINCVFEFTHFIKYTDVRYRLIKDFAVLINIVTIR